LFFFFFLNSILLAIDLGLQKKSLTRKRLSVFTDLLHQWSQFQTD